MWLWIPNFNKRADPNKTQKQDGKNREKHTQACSSNSIRVSSVWVIIYDNKDSLDKLIDVLHGSLVVFSPHLLTVKSHNARVVSLDALWAHNKLLARPSLGILLFNFTS